MMERVSTYTMPITREILESETGHRRNTILQLAQRYPDATTISIAERGRGGRLDPEPGEIIYVMATGGGYGRSSETRVAPNLAETARARLRQEARERAWTPQ